MESKLEEFLENSQLIWGDFIVVAVYFLLVIGVGIWSSCRNRGSTKGYFLAGRSMHFIPVGASLFASNIGSGHFVGLAGSGAANGIGVSVFEFSATYILLLLGWVFVPVYIAAGVFTMPEYLRKRFGGQRIRIFLALLSLLLYIFTKISADIFSGAIFLQQAVGWNIYVSVIALLILAMLFTVAGGLTAVIWTDFAQTIIMVIGATVLCILSFVKVGGYNEVVSLFMSSATQSNITRQCLAGTINGSECKNPQCGVVPANSLNVLRSADDPNLPWTGVLFGLTISSVWYWCSDQVIVQRALAAKNLSHARAGTILAGYLKFLPLWLIVFPGMIARILYPDLIGCGSPDECERACKLRSGCTNVAYPVLVLDLMPVGARGLMISVMMSALMSSLTSIFNSASTIFTMDIWTKMRKDAKEVELLVVGRVFVVILAAVSVAWIPIVSSVPQLFDYIQQITSFLAPPVCAIYVLAVTWKRINEQGAFWGLIIGFIIGIIRFILQYAVYPSPEFCTPEEENTVPDIVRKVHYLHFGCILFVITAIVTIVISFLTKPINPRKLIRLTYPSRFETGERLDQSADDDTPDHLEMFDKDEKEFQSTETVKTTVGSTDQLTPAEPDAPLPWYRVAVNWICGIEKQTEPQLTDEEKAELERKNLSIEEEPRWRTINNVNAIVLIVITTFIWAYFG